MSQTTVNDHPLRAYEGMLAQALQIGGVDSAIASGRVLYGKACGRADADVALGTNATGAQECQALDATNSNFIGVALADVSREQPDGQAYGSYEHEDTVPVLRKGRVWVVSADAVDDLTKSVFVRNANEGALPAAALGSFRATTAVDHIDLGAIAPVRWIAGATIDGTEFGLLEVSF